MNIWVKMCSADVKSEYENRIALKTICDELIKEYLQKTNLG